MFLSADSLIGELKVTQEDTKRNILSQSIVATDRPTEMNVHFYDPSDFLKDFNVSFAWLINDISASNESSTLVQNFTTPKEYMVDVTVTAVNKAKPDMKRFAKVKQTLIAKNVIEKLHVEGKTWITRDRNLDLNITCIGGSPPYSFCRQIFVDNATARNFSCPEAHIVTNTCFFHVSWYFRNSGSYFLVMQGLNDVSAATGNFEIHVVDSKF